MRIDGPRRGFHRGAHQGQRRNAASVGSFARKRTHVRTALAWRGNNHGTRCKILPSLVGARGAVAGDGPVTDRECAAVPRFSVEPNTK
ncbi:MAG TPA: hypothetical protein VND19_16240 [Acetobacteraceae bacterium]|nr:hypothetical protein [Acetobacteraceae bacterium]